MNKRKSLHQKLSELQKQIKELELQEQQKVGSLVIGFYEKNEIRDETLRTAVAKILGDSVIADVQTN